MVTLNYEGGELTSSCVAALRETDWPRDRLQVVLVDNASTDGVADAVEARWPDVTVVRSDTNRGFAGGMNLGLADLDTVDHVALVNNDVILTPGWLAPSSTRSKRRRADRRRVPEDPVRDTVRRDRDRRAGDATRAG